MSLKNNLQEKLSKNGHALDEFFFFYFNLDFDRIAHSHYGISLKSHEGIWLCATDELFKKKYRYGFKICCQRRYEIVDISSFDRDTFRIQIFLDQYGYLGRQLPVFSEEVIASNLIWQNKYKTYDEVRQAMQIMLKPLNTYDDFIERVKEIEVFRQWQIIRPEMLPLGNINNWSWGNIGSELGGITIQQTDESEWQFIPWERGYAQSPSITFFREQAIYEWFVNLYLGLL